MERRDKDMESIMKDPSGRYPQAGQARPSDTEFTHAPHRLKRFGEDIRMDVVTSKLSQAIGWMDQYGKKAWIALMVVCFIFAWPVGLAVLFFLIWSNRMGKKFFRSRRNAAGMKNTRNTAFESYKSETLNRLKQEQKEFEDFLDRLRTAKDQAEFDLFMAQREQKSANA